MPKLTRIIAVLITFAISITASAFALPVCNQTETLTRPIQMGVSGGSFKARMKVRIGKLRLFECCGGTLGSLVVDKKGVDFILSNNHVLTRTNKGGRNDRIVQPGLEDTTPTLCTQNTADTVAKTSRKVSLHFGKGNTNFVDAAIAEIVSGDVDTDGDILNIGPISATTDDPPALDQPVQKQGRTTCLTTGTVTAIDVKVAGILYPQECNSGKGGVANFVKQILITATESTTFVQPGDSGSLVVTNNGAGFCPQAVGLLFADNPDGTHAIVNPIEAVLKRFNVKMVGTCVGPVSAAASDGTISPAAASSTTVNSALSATSAPVVAASAIKDRHESDLFKIPGVIGTGIGTAGQPGKVAIQVYVDHETSQIDSAVPLTLKGMPVKIIETGQFNAF
jgi:hypothetical protein